ncbi:hypothetical protein ACTA71_001489 [Dictyostelium dimigraforme]
MTTTKTTTNNRNKKRDLDSYLFPLSPILANKKSLLSGLQSTKISINNQPKRNIRSTTPTPELTQQPSSPQVAKKASKQVLSFRKVNIKDTKSLEEILSFDLEESIKSEEGKKIKRRY